jgi:hypothetical protein
MWIQCRFQVDSLCMLSGFDVNVIWLQCGFDVDMLWICCTCHVHATWRWFGFDVESGSNAALMWREVDLVRRR